MDNQLRQIARLPRPKFTQRSEEHTSELQSHLNLVCLLLLEKKKGKRRQKDLTAPKTSRRPVYSAGTSMVTARTWHPSHTTGRRSTSAATCTRTSPASPAMND